MLRYCKECFAKLDMIKFLILLSLSAVVVFAISLIDALRMKMIYSALGRTIKGSTLFDASIITNGVNAIIPFGAGGLMARPFVLKKTAQAPYETSLAASAIESLIDFIFPVIVVIMLLIFWFQKNLSLKFPFLTFGIAIAILLIGVYTPLGIKITKSLLDFIARLMPYWLKEKINRRGLHRENILRIVSAIRLLKNHPFKLLAVVLATSFLVFFQPALLYFFFHAFGFKVTYMQSIAMTWLPLFLGKTSGLPAGIGVREGVMIYLLSLANYPLIESTTLTVSYRIFISALTIIAGIIMASKIGLNLWSMRKLSRDSLKMNQNLARKI